MGARVGHPVIGIVGFDEGNGDEFERVLRRARPGGRSDFANALAHAASDFISRDDAASSTVKNLYVFVGDRDTCSSQPVEVVRRALSALRANKDVELALKFVGVKPSPEVREILKAIGSEARSLGYRSRVDFATRRHQLGAALEEGTGGPVPCQDLDPESDEYRRRCP